MPTPFVKATARVSQAEKNGESPSIFDFCLQITAGTVPIQDGTSRPLSGFYGSLLAAQVEYPAATALTDELARTAIQQAINTIGARGGTLLIPPGVYPLDAALTWGSAANVTLRIAAGVTFTGAGSIGVGQIDFLSTLTNHVLFEGSINVDWKNVILGVGAGLAMPGSSYDAVLIGAQCGQYLTQTSNVMIGAACGTFATNSYQNVYAGEVSGSWQVSGVSNTGLGQETLAGFYSHFPPPWTPTAAIGIPGVLGTCTHDGVGNITRIPNDSPFGASLGLTSTPFTSAWIGSVLTIEQTFVTVSSVSSVNAMVVAGYMGGPLPPTTNFVGGSDLIYGQQIPIPDLSYPAYGSYAVLCTAIGAAAGRGAKNSNGHTFLGASAGYVPPGWDGDEGIDVLRWVTRGGSWNVMIGQWAHAKNVGTTPTGVCSISGTTVTYTSGTAFSAGWEQMWITQSGVEYSVLLTYVNSTTFTASRALTAGSGFAFRVPLFADFLHAIAIGSGAEVSASYSGVLGIAGMNWSIGGNSQPRATLDIWNAPVSTNVIIQEGAAQSGALLAVNDSAGTPVLEVTVPSLGRSVLAVTGILSASVGIPDNSTPLVSHFDYTAQAFFSCGAIPTSTTVTLTLPAASVTLAGTDTPHGGTGGSYANFTALAAAILADLPAIGPGAGTYTVGAPLTAITGNNGTITLDAQGRITAVQQAT